MDNEKHIAVVKRTLISSSLAAAISQIAPSNLRVELKSEEAAKLLQAQCVAEFTVNGAGAQRLDASRGGSEA